MATNINEARNVAVTGGINNTITFATEMLATPVIYCYVLNTGGALVGDVTSIVSQSATGFVINPLETGLLSYTATATYEGGDITGMYCSQFDLEKMIGVANLAQLTNDSATATTPDTGVVLAMIQRAQNYMDAQFSGTYDVPFSPVPELVRDIAVDLAIYNCMLRRFTIIQISDDWKNRYKEAMQKIDMICTQDIQFDSTLYPIIAPQMNIAYHDQQFGFYNSDNYMSLY